jgi:hypothetical protein
MHSPYATEMQFTNLIQFRQAAYQRLGKARDAQFELTDAVMLTPAARSFVELTLSPVFRRLWSSSYEAIEDGNPDREGLMRLYAAQIPALPRPLLAGDHTAWPRLSAPTLRDRTIEHHPTKVKGNKPITIGQGYGTLAWLPPDGVRSSWALPCLHERISSAETPTDKGISQLRRVTQALAVRPVSLWDSEYGNATFVNGSDDIPADKVIRLRPNICLWGPPRPYSGRGRRPVHGAKFKLKDPTSWGKPVQVLEVEEAQLGRIRVSLWRGLHFRKAAQHWMIVVRIERLDARGTRRDPKELWLAWVGEEPPPLAEWWHLYLRRFGLEHWYRFAKQRLHWTLPRFSAPEQAERWSDLMPLVTWELWLARQIVADKPLPWQKPQSNLTPGRVCQGMGGVLAVIRTPAQAPKPRGKSPGWPKGRLRKRRERHPVVKKSQKRRA